MNFLNKNLLIGVLVGVVLVLGVQWGMDKYEAKQVSAQVAAFAEGYEKATDKVAFTNSYDFSGKGVAVGLSTSSAAPGAVADDSSGGADSYECTNLQAEYASTLSSWGNLWDYLMDKYDRFDFRRVLNDDERSYFQFIDSRLTEYENRANQIGCNLEKGYGR